MTIKQLQKANQEARESERCSIDPEILSTLPDGRYPIVYERGTSYGSMRCIVSTAQVEVVGRFFGIDVSWRDYWKYAAFESNVVVSFKTRAEIAAAVLCAEALSALSIATQYAPYWGFEWKDKIAAVRKSLEDASVDVFNAANRSCCEDSNIKDLCVNSDEWEGLLMHLEDESAEAAIRAAGGSVSR